MNYNAFDEPLKEYLRKVMDIYRALENKRVNFSSFRAGTVRNNIARNFDKKVLSIFMAGFFCSGSLRSITKDFDDIGKEDLLSFCGLEESEIVSTTEDEYATMFEDDFLVTISNLLEKKWMFYDVNKISPEVIFTSSSAVSLGTDILIGFFEFIDRGIFIISAHPVFDAAEKKAIFNGDITKKDFSSKGKSNSGDMGALGLMASILAAPSAADMEKEKEENKPKKPKIDYNSDEIWDLCDDVLAKFIGQEQAAEGLFYNILNNQQMIQNGQMVDGQRSIIFLDGPTGTGKTAITRDITNKLDIPFVATSINNYSQTGYVGDNLTDILVELYEKSGEDLEKAERGIIVLDEFDKIASKEGGLEMKKAVQQQLLDFMGGGKYTIKVGGMFGKKIEFDTSKITFVCLGALTDLRASKTGSNSRKMRRIGFDYEGRDNLEVHTEETYSVTPQDLIDIGLERELVGRFNTYLHTDEYPAEMLLKILKISTISPLLTFKSWIESKNKVLEIEPGALEMIAKYAYEMHTGARSLQTVMNNIRTSFLKQVMRGKDPVIYLTKELVEKVCSESVTRKVVK